MNRVLLMTHLLLSTTDMKMQLQLNGRPQGQANEKSGSKTLSVYVHSQVALCHHLTDPLISAIITADINFFFLNLKCEWVQGKQILPKWSNLLRKDHMHKNDNQGVACKK